jgi:RsiW-degrading membrane proteinase PrsW (M82 family)
LFYLCTAYRTKKGNKAMSVLILLTASLLPAVLLWLYVWKKDEQPEPAAWLLKAALKGVVICIPVAVVEVVISDMLFSGDPTTLLGTTLEAFFVAALPEESFKLLALWLVLRNNPYFDEHYDGIVYAVCVGLGFASVENVFYVFGAENDWLGVAVARALLAVPGHYAFAVLMGYFYSVYHFVDRSPRVAASILLVPVVCHGIYDALALSGTVNETVGGLCAIVLIVFCIRLQKFAYRKLLAQVERDKQEREQYYGLTDHCGCRD